MPVQSIIDKELPLVIGAAWGRVTFAEIKAHQDKLLSDPDFDPEFNQFMDGSRITEWAVLIDEAEIVTRRRLFSPSSQRAFVVPHPIESALAGIFVAFNELTKHASKVRVFQDVPSALEWLGVDALPASKACTNEPLANGVD